MDTIEQSVELLPACPDLRVMELWGCRGYDGLIFRFKVDPEARRASITWSSCRSHNPSLSRAVEKSWLDATAIVGEHPLAIRNETIDETELAMRFNHDYHEWCEGGTLNVWFCHLRSKDLVHLSYD
ncbi:unnamed protein product [Clonostachys rosea]|uniref:DUF6546 domain-containing protein n=1 Tax=Bionectria ochroleuca TaxID=29856 RepID=A0ABY6UPW7_BIOOC|nr:unnamed protein product [Clonostachys rosea]